MSIARRTGTGDPPSVTLSTSMDLRSGLLLLCLVSRGESTRFLGGSVRKIAEETINPWQEMCEHSSGTHPLMSRRERGAHYQSHYVEAGSGPHGWDTALYGPAGGSKSSSPGCH